MKPKTTPEVLAALTALCATAEYCSADMTARMDRWEVDPATQAEVMATLVSERYIDDARYCRLFVSDKIRFNHWGRRKIEQALWAKRIDKAVERAVLDEVSDEEYLAVLRPLLKQKARTVKARSGYELNQKLIRFALGRGFTYDLIRQCIDTDQDFDCFD